MVEWGTRRANGAIGRLTGEGKCAILVLRVSECAGWTAFVRGVLCEKTGFSRSAPHTHAGGLRVGSGARAEATAGAPVGHWALKGGEKRGILVRSAQD